MANKLRLAESVLLPYPLFPMAARTDDSRVDTNAAQLPICYMGLAA